MKKIFILFTLIASVNLFASVWKCPGDPKIYQNRQDATLTCQNSAYIERRGIASSAVPSFSALGHEPHPITGIAGPAT